LRATSLTPALVRDLTREVFRCGTRRELDALTRNIWREHGKNAANDAALAQLKTVILARRAAVDRGPPG
jgi:hypothetical protein